LKSTGSNPPKRLTPLPRGKKRGAGQRLAAAGTESDQRSSRKLHAQLRVLQQEKNTGGPMPVKEREKKKRREGF